MTAREFFGACLNSGLDRDEFEAAFFLQLRLFPETFDPEQQTGRGSGSRSKSKKKAPRNQMSILEKEGGEGSK